MTRISLHFGLSNSENSMEKIKYIPMFKSRRGSLATPKRDSTRALGKILSPFKWLEICHHKFSSLYQASLSTLENIFSDSLSRLQVAKEERNRKSHNLLTPKAKKISKNQSPSIRRKKSIDSIISTQKKLHKTPSISKRVSLRSSSANSGSQSNLSILPSIALIEKEISVTENTPKTKNILDVNFNTNKESDINSSLTTELPIIQRDTVFKRGRGRPQKNSIGSSSDQVSNLKVSSTESSISTIFNEFEPPLIPMETLKHKLLVDHENVSTLLHHETISIRNDTSPTISHLRHSTKKSKRFESKVPEVRSPKSDLLLEASKLISSPPTELIALSNPQIKATIIQKNDLRQSISPCLKTITSTPSNSLGKRRTSVTKSTIKNSKPTSLHNLNFSNHQRPINFVITPKAEGAQSSNRVSIKSNKKNNSTNDSQKISKNEEFSGLLKLSSSVADEPSGNESQENSASTSSLIMKKKRGRPRKPESCTISSESSIINSDSLCGITLKSDHSNTLGEANDLNKISEILPSTPANAINKNYINITSVIDACKTDKMKITDKQEFLSSTVRKRGKSCKVVTPASPIISLKSQVLEPTSSPFKTPSLRKNVNNSIKKDLAISKNYRNDALISSTIRANNESVPKLEAWTSQFLKNVNDNTLNKSKNRTFTDPIIQGPGPSKHGEAFSFSRNQAIDSNTNLSTKNAEFAANTHAENTHQDISEHQNEYSASNDSNEITDFSISNNLANKGLDSCSKPNLKFDFKNLRQGINARTSGPITDINLNETRTLAIPSSKIEIVSKHYNAVEESPLARAKRIDSQNIWRERTLQQFYPGPKLHDDKLIASSAISSNKKSSDHEDTPNHAAPSNNINTNVIDSCDLVTMIGVPKSSFLPVNPKSSESTFLANDTNKVNTSQIINSPSKLPVDTDSNISEEVIPVIPKFLVEFDDLEIKAASEHEKISTAKSTNDLPLTSTTDIAYISKDSTDNPAPKMSLESEFDLPKIQHPTSSLPESKCLSINNVRDSLLSLNDLEARRRIKKRNEELAEKRFRQLSVTRQSKADLSGKGPTPRLPGGTFGMGGFVTKPGVNPPKSFIPVASSNLRWPVTLENSINDQKMLINPPKTSIASRELGRSPNISSIDDKFAMPLPKTKTPNRSKQILSSDVKANPVESVISLSISKDVSPNSPYQKDESKAKCQSPRLPAFSSGYV